MPSFEFADCPTRLDVAEATQGGERIQKGTLALTVRNRTERSRIGRITIEAGGAAKPDWFSFEGALPTNPREIERDFAAKGTETIRANLQVPSGAPAGSHVFRVRVTAEDDPDNDFTISPNVAFDVAASAPAPQPKENFPWWAIAVAAALVLIIGGVALYMLMTPGGPKVPRVIGLPWEQAKARLDVESIEAERLVHVISPVLPPSRFATRVLAMEPQECETIPSNTKLKVYVGARNDPFFCRACDNRQLDSLDPETRQRVQAGATLTVVRFFGVAGPTKVDACP
jgi:hypothetical protein